MGVNQRCQRKEAYPLCEGLTLPGRPSTVGAVATKNKETSFESTLLELEKIIGDLEQGEQPLENQLKAFERGIALSRECLKRLDEVERKVQLLVQDETGEAKPVDFAE